MSLCPTGTHTLSVRQRIYIKVPYMRLGLSENVQILLGAGAKTNVKDKSDLTVIDYLADPRLEKMLQRLMEMGKDECSEHHPRALCRQAARSRGHAQSGVCVVRVPQLKVYVRVMHDGYFIVMGARHV